MGIKDLALVLKCAFLSSVLTALPFLTQYQFTTDGDVWYTSNVMSLAADYTSAQSASDVNRWISQALDKPVDKLQHQLYDQLMPSMRSSYEAGMPTDDDAVRRYNSTKHVDSGKFLLCIPRSGWNTFSDAEFTSAVRLRLDMSLSPSSSMKCDCARKTMLDLPGQHLLCCLKGGGWYLRHQYVLN